MKLPDGRPLAVDGGILTESSPEGRVILWVPGESGRGYQEWERVIVAAHATVRIDRGVASIAATSVPVRQRLGGPLARFFGGPRADRAWTFPGGTPVEQCGERRTDLRLAWAVDEATPRTRRGAASRRLWPGRHSSRALGPNLYLITGVVLEELPPGAPAAQELPADESPRALAARGLDAARAANDRPRTVMALADLGLALLLEGDTRRAAATLAEARAGARGLGNPVLEADVMSNLALVACYAGQPEQGRGLITPVLDYARAVGDRYAEKLALDRLALALVGLGDHAGALVALSKAVALAVTLDDRTHEADILWRAAIAHAELGQRERALAAGGTAVERLRLLGNPKAAWYAHHLANFRSGAPGPALGATAAPGFDAGRSIAAGIGSAPLEPAAAPASSSGATGPGLLRMALTAAKSMAAFVGSGFRMASPESYRARLAVCSACAHHTGLRCRICGCITAAKARIHHERCPASRWPV